MQYNLFPDDVSPAARRGPHTDRLILPKLLQRAARDGRFRGQEQDAAHEIIIKWADLESGGKLARMKESQLAGEFLSEVFGAALHYTLFSENLPIWQLWPEFSINAGAADAALGEFSADADPEPTAVIELKGPKADLDRDRSGGRTAVQQCWDYLNDLACARWGIVTNIVSFRLYHHRHPRRQFEHFSLRELRDPDRFAQFYVLFERGGLLPSALRQTPRAQVLLDDTNNAQREVSGQLYELYRDNRLALVRHLIRERGRSIDDAIGVAQKLLDRILFIAFCEDRGLLPPGMIADAWEKFSPFEKATNPRWRNFMRLFESIDQGNPSARIARFNGRLFAHDPQLDDEQLLDDRWTNFFNEVASYDFRDQVHLDVLGHIFERSITDLELLRADPELTLAQPDKPTLSRRKREGIYYTPPHVTRFLVENTLGAVIDQRFATLAEQFGVEDQSERPRPRALANWIKFQEARLEALRSLRVLDPACGSGAFLIQAFDFLEEKYAEVITTLGKRQGKDDTGLDERTKADILTRNLHGVDLSEESVEITRLALWIRTAERGKTLADLSQNVQRGNSLVDDADVDPHAFDWQACFPDIFADGGFDCVIGNPPYVKLQNFRRQQPEVAAWLAKRYDAATGNFDMYLPFVERGLELLAPDGRLGIIAPSVWLYNEYGRGLRGLVSERRSLARFVDFKSHQVFEGATTYTALQLFSKSPQERIVVADARSGNLSQLNDFAVSYERLGQSAWALLDEREQAILDRMREGSVTLADAAAAIIVGIQTSADAIYHTIRIASRKYFSQALGRVVEIEDALMKPVVSGEDASPFAVAPPRKHLLFPYDVDGSGAHLIDAKRMKKRFPHAWAYLKENEQALRAREAGKFDEDQGWWRFGRHQNMDKQETPKILVPRLLLHLFAASDAAGKLYIDNVDVGGIVPGEGWKPQFILGLLNSRALDFVWRLTSKPFRGEYRSANKQFIAPLPVPAGKDQGPLARLAGKLAKLHAARHEGLGKVWRRFATDLPTTKLLETSPLPPKLSGKLRGFDTFDMSALLPAMEELAERRLKMEERDHWQDYLAPQMAAIEQLNHEIAELQGTLDREVYALFGLTSDDVRIIEKAPASG